MSRTAYLQDTHLVRFIEESYRRERDARLNWYKDRFGDEGIPATAKVDIVLDMETPQTSKRFQVMKKKIENSTKPFDENITVDKRLTEGKREPRSFGRKKANFNKVKTIQLEYNEDAPLNDMKPVSAETKKLLYDGLSKEGKGTHQYLQSRYKKYGPDEKYDFPTVSSYEYGWGLGGNNDFNHRPTHGRQGIVQSTFYTRNNNG
ncbi:unnamed protein product [Owenia fusiformis]|uniref:Sperm microtubule inner protein 1 C-terminal domain-containing protein n=1 Tax=Owenia fusiformis TaxID=6347 RepID=A0A8S4Q499_OWEFU|nr:unnamed protein product [Owenia fusiformis]